MLAKKYVVCNLKKTLIYKIQKPRKTTVTEEDTVNKAVKVTIRIVKKLTEYDMSVKLQRFKQIGGCSPSKLHIFKNTTIL